MKKHGGHVGIKKKVDAKARRESKKRLRERGVAEANHTLSLGISLSSHQPLSKKPHIDVKTSGIDSENSSTRSTSTSSSAMSNTPLVVPPTKQRLDDIKKNLQNGLRALMTWDYLRSKRSPNGTTATAQVFGVTQLEYCHLAGKANDPTLASVLKKGAYYTVYLRGSELFGAGASLTGRGGKYGGNSQLGLDMNEQIGLKFKPSNRSISISAYIGIMQ